jgi:hypothetical protein
VTSRGVKFSKKLLCKKACKWLFIDLLIDSSPSEVIVPQASVDDRSKNALQYS